jgi:hypothetical protein
MSAFKGMACAGFVGLGLIAGAPNRVDAGGFGVPVAHGGYNLSPGPYGGYGPYTTYGGYGGGGIAGYGKLGGYGIYPGYGGLTGGAVWHDTSHFDYYPGGYVPHGNHLDYVPGHSAYHRDGHWDYYGRGPYQYNW